MGKALWAVRFMFTGHPPRCHASLVAIVRQLPYALTYTLPDERRAADIAMSCDLMLVVGSSVMVYSAFRLVELAKGAGASIALLNVGPTRADKLASLKVSVGQSKGVTAWRCWHIPPISLLFCAFGPDDPSGRGPCRRGVGAFSSSPQYATPEIELEGELPELRHRKGVERPYCMGAKARVRKDLQRIKSGIAFPLTLRSH